MNAANDNARAHSPRNAATDIAALLRSGHVEAGGALPLTQRVQTSGRGDPQPPRWSAEGERAQRILGRAWAEGGEARRCALALWLLHASAAEPLAIGLGVLLPTDDERRRTVREWSRWGVGGSADSLAASGVELLGRAVGWYESASEEPGHAGALGQLVTAADGISDREGVVGRLREWHAGWVVGRVDCAELARRLRCVGSRPPRGEVVRQPRCDERPFSWSPAPGSRVDRAPAPTCALWDEDCASEWGVVCEPRATERRVAA